jgi:multicomponent Na+:H+ antiporter subunit F
MSTLFAVLAGAMILLMVPYVGRVISGPTIFDRLVGLAGIGTKVAVLIVVLGVLYDRAEMFVDISLAFLLLNLVTTLVIARHVKERRLA